MAGSETAGSISHLRVGATLAAAVLAATAILTVAQRAFAAAAPATLAAIGAAATEALFILVLFALLLGVALVGIRLDGGRPGLIGPAPARSGAAGAAIGLFGLLAATALAALAATISDGTGEAQGGAAIAIGTLAILFQAAVEEVYFRGWLQPALVRGWGRAAGLIVAAAAFAALHVAGGARAPLTLVNLLLGGLLFGLLALRSGGLVAPIAAHAAYNWAEQILLGLDPNPGSGSFGAIVDLDLAGSALWGGSGEGLNASLAVSFVLTALILPLATWRRPPAAAAIPLARPG